MTRRKIIICSLSVLAVIATVVGLNFWMQSSQPAETIQKNEPSRSETVKQNTPSPLQAVEAPLPENSDEVQVSDMMKFQMADVAEAYKENIRYPKYSKPLNMNDWDLLHPQAFIPRDTPLNNHPRVSASIVVDQYIVNRDQDLPVKVIIKGQDDTDYATGVNLSLIADGSNRSLISLNETEWDEGVSVFSGTVPAGMVRDVAADEVTLRAEITFSNNNNSDVAAVIRLFDNQATLTSLGEPYVEGANLIIPAYFTVKNPGNYSVRANLFDKSDEQPISHLNSVFQLSSENNSGLIKVHAATLRSKGSQGPYLLKDFNITKKPSKPGDKTGYGSSESSSFIVQGFPLNNYSEEAYENPKNKQRLEFLQKLAGSQ